MTEEHDKPRTSADGGGGGSDQGGAQPVGSVPGIDEDASVQLAIAGVATVEELVAADPAELSDRTDIPAATIREWIDAASGPGSGADDPDAGADPAEDHGAHADASPAADSGATGSGGVDAAPGSTGSRGTDPEPAGASEGDPGAGRDPTPDPEPHPEAEPMRDHEAPPGTDTTPDRDAHPEADRSRDHGTHPEADPMRDHEAPREADADSHPAADRTRHYDASEADPDPAAGPDRGSRSGGSAGPHDADGSGPSAGAGRSGTADGPDVTPVDDATGGGSAGGQEEEVTVARGEAESSGGYPTEDELEREILGIDDVAGEGEVFCHECGATIDELAELCPECGAEQEGLDRTSDTGPGSGTGTTVGGGSTTVSSGDEKNPMVAAGLSLLIPGAGQGYNGQYKRAAVAFGALALGLGLDLVAFLLFLFLGLGLLGVLLAFVVIGVVHLVINGGAAYDAYSQAGKINSGAVSLD